VERKVWLPQTEPALGASGLQARHRPAERTGSEDAAGQTPAPAVAQQRLPRTPSRVGLCWQSRPGPRQEPGAHGSHLKHFRPVPDREKPSLPIPPEETFPHTECRAPPATATSHRHIRTPDPGRKPCFIAAQQRLRGPGSKRGCTAPTLADSTWKGGSEATLFLFFLSTLAGQGWEGRGEKSLLPAPVWNQPCSRTARPGDPPSGVRRRARNAAARPAACPTHEETERPGRAALETPAAPAARHPATLPMSPGFQLHGAIPEPGRAALARRFLPARGPGWSCRSWRWRCGWSWGSRQRTCCWGSSGKRCVTSCSSSHPGSERQGPSSESRA